MMLQGKGRACVVDAGVEGRPGLAQRALARVDLGQLNIRVGPRVGKVAKMKNNQAFARSLCRSPRTPADSDASWLAERLPYEDAR